MTDLSIDTYSAMQTGVPYKIYKKVILGRVYLDVLNPFSKKPDGIILQGDPRSNEKGCFLKIWSPQEDVYLHNQNESHFTRGTIAEMEKPMDNSVKQFGNYSEDDVAELVNSHHIKFQNELNKIDSEAFLFRILTKAKELDKSEKIIAKIEARLAEVQYSEPE